MNMTDEWKRTALNSWHREQGAQMVEFAGWDMPVAYKSGILEEHLATRRYAGLFDISHMGRFLIAGDHAIPFLQKFLTNNALALDPGRAQYTLIQNEGGGAIDDAYLYRLDEQDPYWRMGYLLVVNAANKEKDWRWFGEQKGNFPHLSLEDQTDEMAMIALQGPRSKRILEKLLGKDRCRLPEPRRNYLRVCQIEGIPVVVSRTGYTGEPLCFELFLPRERARMIWEKLLFEGQEEGIAAIGLGARDTLRLEAGLPLYGHELGTDAEGKEIPIFAVPSCRMAVSFSSLKGEFFGKGALRCQFEEVKARIQGDPLPPEEEQAVPKRIVPVAIRDQGIARQGSFIFAKGEAAGQITSGTMVPYWKFSDQGLLSQPSGEKGRRPIALAYLDADLREGEEAEIRQRGRSLKGLLVERHLSGEAPPYARPILGLEESAAKQEPQGGLGLEESAKGLLYHVMENTRWRQRETINLIPSEQTPSSLVRWLTISDPAGRYAEHRLLKALGGKEVFYYQGTKLIEEVEILLSDEIRRFLGCSEVEIRVVSGQMANTAAFGGLADYLNRADRRSEPRRISKVLNHHLGRGGHLSAQPLGSLRDFVARDPRTERPAVVHFPVREENPYQIDLAKTKELIEFHRPPLIILGKSMILHKEPAREIAEMVSGMKPKPIILYDAAHVLGLLGPLFQEPFQEGVDLVTGSTHKTFFGPQRGIIASNMAEEGEHRDLWRAIVRRAFPGSVSNHHLGTLIGLLMAACEMNAFRHEYQKAVLTNAKAFAFALKERGLEVEGDPGIGYTETHQVILRVGYGKGPEMAYRLEENNIIVNYQAAPDDEGFTAASCLRMGVQEMTRFGMKPEDFSEVAEHMYLVIRHNRRVAREVSQLRGRFTEMRYCLSAEQTFPWVAQFMETINGR
jgi:aminomethyltransferase